MLLLNPHHQWIMTTVCILGLALLFVVKQPSIVGFDAILQFRLPDCTTGGLRWLWSRLNLRMDLQSNLIVLILQPTNHKLVNLFIPQMRSSLSFVIDLINWMFPQNQNNEDEHRIQFGEDLEEEVTDYSHVTKHPYETKLFCWIEKGDTKQVIKFFTDYPHLINEFYTPNNWNPFMYAVRYANMELIEFFTEKKMRVNVNSIFSHVSMIHSAVYSGDIRILKHVLNVMKCSPNPPNSETSPLKIAMKMCNAKMVEMLICKGAYYVFGDVYNNIQPKSTQSNEEGIKYVSLLNGGKDIMNSAVVEDSTIKDCTIKETLRWARIRQLIHLQKRAKKAVSDPNFKTIETKFDAMAEILSNSSYFNLILKMSIGNGDSITKSTEVNQEPREKEEKTKETKDRMKP